jgi:hypothetical protein
MDLLFHPKPGREVRITSHAGSWFARLKTIEIIRCSHGESHTIPIDWRREVGADDEGALLNSFEAALRAGVAETAEQKDRAARGALLLSDVLLEEAVHELYVDPCIIP